MNYFHQLPLPLPPLSQHTLGNHYNDYSHSQSLHDSLYSNNFIDQDQQQHHHHHQYLSLKETIRVPNNVYQSSDLPIDNEQEREQLNNHSQLIFGNHYSFTDQYKIPSKESNFSQLFSISMGPLPTFNFPFLNHNNQNNNNQEINNNFQTPTKKFDTEFPFAKPPVSINNNNISQQQQQQQQSNPRNQKPTNTINTTNCQSTLENTKVKLSWYEFQQQLLLNSSGQQLLSPNLNNTTNLQDYGYEGGDDDDDEPPSRILWIGNIGMDVDQDDLQYNFEKFGAVDSIRILHDRYCAFINYKDIGDAIMAKKKMNHQIIGSQKIIVNYRQSKITTTSATIDSEPTNQNNKMMPSRTIYIGNLSNSYLQTEKDIEKECSKFGEIESIRFLRKKNCVFVNFVSTQDSLMAINELNGKKWGDTVIKVNYGKPQPSSSSPPHPQL